MPTSRQEKPSAEHEKHQRQEHSAAIGQPADFQRVQDLICKV
jgi:hypothetical protein